MPRARYPLLIACCLALAACSARKPAGPPAVAAAGPLVDVTALIRHGCFRCLEQALVAADGERKLEVALLLAVRAKELGLPYALYRTTAQSVLPSDTRFAPYLDIVDAIPVNPLAGDQYLDALPLNAAATRTDRGDPGASQRLPPGGQRVPAWREAVRSGPGSDLFRRYIELAIDCSLAPQGQRDNPNGDETSADADVPLLRYRASICGRQGDRLRALRAEDPDFVDADFALARYALGARPADLDDALRWMESARGAFPSSVAIATALGDVRQEREEWAEALVAYEAVLRGFPQHRDALLGRTVALSHLARHEEAIASATRMIDLGSWFLGEAHYWRAWNEFSLQQYPAARADTDRAKSLMVNAAVFVLSGLVEWNERRLPTAESEFEEALKMDFGRCDAAWYLGRVRVQEGRLAQAKAAFQQAIQCFDLAITVRQKAIAEIVAGPASDATRARLTAGHQRAIDAAVRDRQECRNTLAALDRRGTF